MRLCFYSECLDSDGDDAMDDGFDFDLVPNGDSKIDDPEDDM